MASNIFQQARETADRVLKTTRAAGQKFNDYTASKTFTVNPDTLGGKAVMATMKLGEGAGRANRLYTNPTLVTNTMPRPLEKAYEGFAEASTAGLYDPKIAPSKNIAEKAGYGLGFAAGFLNPYNIANRALGNVGKVGGNTAAKIAPKLGTLGTSITRGAGSEAAQTLAYAGASRVASNLGLNDQKGQFDPKNLSMNVGLGIAARGAGNFKEGGALINNFFGRERELNLNAQDLVQAQKVLRNKGKVSGQELESAKKAIYDLADRHLTPQQKDALVNSPLKLAKAIEKELNKPKPQVYPTVLGFADQSTPKIANAVDNVEKPFNPKEYVNELMQKRQDAKASPVSSLAQKGKSFMAEIKQKMVDSFSPIEDALSSAEKKYNFKTLPSQDVRLQVDRVLRSKTLASKFAEDNGLVNAIQRAPDLDMLDQYLIAKQASKVAQIGKETGRDLTKDKMLINSLSAEYEPIAKEVNNYSRNLLNYAVDTGLVDKKTAVQLIKQYPDYVPLNRVFGEMEGGGVQGLGKGVSSLSKQSVVKKLEGSKREIESPIESLLLKTQTAFAEGEKNKAAKMLASYRKLPGFDGLIREVQDGERVYHKISYLDNGVKKTFAVTPEIETAAKNLDAEQMGLIGKIFSVPTRVLQLGATGLNVPFVVTNLAKDQMTTFINSNRATKTSLLNPANFARALFSAVSQNDLYDEVVRSAAGGTSFDIARQAPDLTVKALRAERSTGAKIKYTATNPKEWLRAIEDIVGRGEQVTRIQNFKGTKDALLKEGRTMQDAQLLAAQAARENTANFARKGTWGKTLNWIIPFFNAGIQGARQTVRSVQNNPKGTAAKMTVGLFMPVAAATAWNLSDPQRKQIYDDIPAYEKENNIVVIPPNPTQDSRGVWNVVKIPVPPGLSNLASMVRRPLEAANGLNPVKFSEMVNNLFTAGTSIDVSSPNKVASTFTPALVKPVVEGVTNTNLFTGQKIVPESMKNLPPEAQVQPNTSLISRGIGKVLNTSPIMVENMAGTIGGGLGRQLTGQETPIGNLERRFAKAQGGAIISRMYDESDKVSGIEAQIKNLVKSGQKEEARKIIEKNRALLSKADTINEFRTQISDLYADRRKVEASTTMTPEQKQKILNAISQRLRKYSAAYYNFERGDK